MMPHTARLSSFKPSYLFLPVSLDAQEYPPNSGHSARPLSRISTIQNYLCHQTSPIYLHVMNILDVLYYKRITPTGCFSGHFPNILNHTKRTVMEWNYK